MTPITLTLTGIRSFTKKTLMDFTTGPGLFQLAGKNGAGKTSLWDGVSWVLFGKTLRGLKGPSVVSWGEKTGEGVLVFSVRGERYTVTRTQSPNSLTLKGGGRPKAVEVDQEEIDKVLGYEWEAFCYAIVMGQFSTFFFDLSPTEKLRIFSQSLKLDIWEVCRKKAGEWKKEVDAQVLEVESKKGKVTARLQELALSTSPANLEQQVKEMTAKEKELGRMCERFDVLIREVKGKLADATQAESKATDEQLELDRKAQLRSKKVRDVSEKRTTVKGDVKAISDRVYALDKQMADIEKQKGGECPVCTADLSPEHTKAAIKLLRKRQETTNKLLEEAQATLELAEKEVTAAFEASKEMDTSLAKKHQEVKQLELRVAEYRTTLKDYERDLATTHHDQGAIGLSIVEVRSHYESQVERVNKFEQELKELSDEETKLKAKIRRLESSQEVFKQIRLWVIDSALEELKVLTNSYLKQLGLKKWSVEFAVEREKKGGSGLIRGFSVFIRSPDSGEESVPWEAWSGGETQRLRVAGACAVSLLIRSRLGIDGSFEVWDEPTQFVEAEGINRMVDFFETRARKLGRAIWFVDHRSLNHGTFDGAFLVSKGANGSTITRTD